LTLRQNIGKIVRSTASRIVKIFAGTDTLLATPEHPVYESTRGWTLAGKLRKGMGLLLATGLTLSIDSVAAVDTTCTVYNADVPVTHTYFVGRQHILALTGALLTVDSAATAVRAETPVYNLPLIRNLKS
jgi:Pretoxin HINT domain